MATTVQQVITAALGMSFKNRADTIATAGVELTRRVGYELVSAFAFAARVNPDYFGTATVVDPANGSWLIPTIAESVLWVERVSTGEEVVVSDVRERAVNAGLAPTVYQRGQYLFPGGNANDPAVSEKLLFWFAGAAVIPSAVDETLDARWPDRFVPILEYGVAAYLDGKDGRPDDKQDHLEQQGDWLTLFQQHLEHQMTAGSKLANVPRRAAPKVTVPAK